ncbi:hypothetical protein EMIHUDRAFT_228473 [Emiliania huxleyi CCMP1516]|uniref:BZIP domain-containing protein n=2 Tax=Emiliania huxleyi TaxID=2903 RepID=A0A0D3KFI5_EMIH1|nr:hypothetical protein EMIHUDRAFT_228473 [Emiliania huxleyi CCMP1516]EOD34520.1 hypothetical protein EMIHUDRAFT_228473 [Emiliania huxleyi CCMP1516]|eukprot:XP_005786949.1 hypothetical protein EMIHUDRAFT_228473 [Emiliania huxleyi CCMP1516]
MMRQTPQPTDPGSSEPVSETESGCESADPIAPETVRMLRLELEGERRQNKQWQAKLKRAAKLNEQLVEMEEENITNKLYKKLEQVKQEKVSLENLLEQARKSTPPVTRPLAPR